MALVGEVAVLTQQAEQLSMESGLGNHWDLVWCDNPNVSWLPAHPMVLDSFFCKRSRTCVGQPTPESIGPAGLIQGSLTLLLDALEPQELRQGEAFLELDGTARHEQTSMRVPV